MNIEDGKINKKDGKMNNENGKANKKGVKMNDKNGKMNLGDEDGKMNT